MHPQVLPKVVEEVKLFLAHRASHLGHIVNSFDIDSSPRVCVWLNSFQLDVVFLLAEMTSLLVGFDEEIVRAIKAEPTLIVSRIMLHLDMSDKIQNVFAEEVTVWTCQEIFYLHRLGYLLHVQVNVLGKNFSLICVETASEAHAFVQRGKTFNGQHFLRSLLELLM